ncbi:MAG: hypothetical protein JSW34_08730 [Candidatus Zixiibacteriota bacterium]|nr:MAG: hypothetical protein JSW34_08730 [candidate division Zixibacteria bacterium]
MRKADTRSRALNGGMIVSFLIVPMLVGALFISGCGDTSLMPEADDSYGDGTSFFERPFDADALAKPSYSDIDTSYVVVEYLEAAEGGVLLMDGAEDLSTAEALVIQAESFVADTTFVVEVIKIVTIDGESPIIYEFQPDGLQFSKPAILRVNAWADFGHKATKVRLFWLNEVTSEWELQAETQVDPETGMAYFDCLDHFSKWGTDDGGSSTNEPSGPDDGSGSGGGGTKPTGT